MDKVVLMVLVSGGSGDGDEIHIVVYLQIYPWMPVGS